LRTISHDSGGDGWTNIEEERLGLAPGSGYVRSCISDENDICSNYAPKADEGSDEELLQKAVLAEYLEELQGPNEWDPSSMKLLSEVRQASFSSEAH